MKMRATVFIGSVAFLSIVIENIHYFVPITRSGTHTVMLNGSIEEVWAVFTDTACFVSAHVRS